jgi:hypothetical protein
MSNLIRFASLFTKDIIFVSPKFDIRAFGYCGKCFLPLGRGESTDDFHAPGPTGGPMCIVFQMVASKALSCGCRLWQQKLDPHHKASSESEQTLPPTAPLLFFRCPTDPLARAGRRLSLIFYDQGSGGGRREARRIRKSVAGAGRK